jgi:hypothetical protein
MSNPDLQRRPDDCPRHLHACPPASSCGGCVLLTLRRPAPAPAKPQREAA